MVHKTPQWKKRTPSTQGNAVLIEWMDRYSELMESGYSKCDAISRLAEEEGLHFNTVYRHIHPQVNERQKKYQSGRWQRERENSEMQKRDKERRNHYQRLRYHLPDHVKSSFSEQGQALTLEEISDSIQERTGVAIAPSTLERSLLSSAGRQLLYEVPNSDPPSYRLAPGTGSNESCP